MSAVLKSISEAGTSIWLDDLSRERMVLGGKSKHFTATRGIASPSAALKLCSHKGSSQVEPGDFTSVLQSRLRTLYAQ